MNTGAPRRDLAAQRKIPQLDRAFGTAEHSQWSIAGDIIRTAEKVEF